MKDDSEDLALTRAAHRAAAVAARAIAQLAAEPGPVVVPSLVRITRADTEGHRRATRARPVVLSLTYSGTARGVLLLKLSSGSARRLLERLVPGRPVRLKRLTPVQRSALTESANVALCAWLASMSAQLGRRLMPSTPRLTVTSGHGGRAAIPGPGALLVAELRLLEPAPRRSTRRDGSPGGEIRGMLIAQPA